MKREAVDGIYFRAFSQLVDLAISVKLDEDWLAVVAQAARSTQLSYSACRLRKFGFIIGGSCHTALELRFLIVHPGGVAVSKPLSVVGEQGILRVFISMLMWRPEEDAGILDSFHDRLDLDIPA